ncbi:enoyl-CoA hydratase-related protein [Streptomyces sp. NPDC088354]|uniref:enoyl-CoA hydratase-related protein n=1 Tax=Streptomyces sp. NPDC088354 TaxID=3365856 RepID=UPI0037FD18B2
MHILLVASAFNSLTQRALVELTELGHSVAVEVTPDGAAVRAAVARYEPELVLAPMLKAAIPPDVCAARTCLVVHPGPPGDRGPASLDRAIQEGAAEWGVTVLQAEAEMDAGAVWASVGCAVPPVGKSDLYRGEISDAAMEAVLLAVDRVASGAYLPRPQTDAAVRPHIRARPAVTQDERRVDWAHDTTGTVLRKLRAADSRPGVLDELLGARWFLHGGHPEQRLRGEPGRLLATRAGAVCRATSDGAVWIPRLRARRTPGGPGTFALPAVTALGALLPDLPEVPARDADEDDWADIRYREQGAAGVLSFSIPGGAMSTDVCRRLLTAYRRACARPTSVLVLGGGRDVFSNGIDLKTIEAAADPAAESWANITAMNDLVEAVLTTTDRLVVAALGGNAGAGGVMLALAADEVWCRQGVVLNPHYRLMGLYGSEYWTYSLPRRVGTGTARRLTERAMPVGATEAMRLGLVDRLLMCGPRDFAADVRRLAARLAGTAAAQARIAAKKADLERREAVQPLSAYRDAELARMRATFSDPEAPYHALRAAFVRSRPSPGCGTA